MFRKNSGIEKFQAEEGGSFTVWSKIFLSHRTEKTSPGNHSVFQEISSREKIFMDKRGEGGGREVSQFSVQTFLSHSVEQLRIGTLQCFTNVGYQKLLGINRKMVLCWHRHVFCRHTNILIKICPQLKTRLLFKI